jgi:hypothetical protein
VNQVVRRAGLGGERPLVLGQRDAGRGETGEDREPRQEQTPCNPHSRQSRTMAHPRILSRL